MRNQGITVQELCRKLKPIFGTKMDQLFLKYTMTDSREKKAEIEQALSVLYEKYLNTTLLNDTILLEPPTEDDVDAEYKLGTVTYADNERCTFGLREKDWIRHVCISGMSGSGKTMFAFTILKNMIEKDKPFIVFDWKKSFRPLLLMDKNMMCFTVGNSSIANLFKININKPPKGIPPKQWVNTLCDMITESFFASYGVHKILRETLDRAFQDFGVYKGSNNYPTWYQIRDRLESKSDSMHGRSRESEWLESSLRIAYALTFGNFGESINCKDEYGTSVEELFDKRAIFELQSLNGMEKKFFCEFMLSYIYFAKKARNEESPNKFQSIVLVDEAHNIFLKDRPNFIKESVTDMVYRELREFGVGLICLDQHISKLSDVVAGNSATNIAFQQFLPQDVETIANIMQLRDHRNYFNMLPVGTAIVKLAERFHSPFLIKAPFIKSKETQVNDDLIKERMSKLIKDTKRVKLFQESVKDENLKKQLEKVNNIFNASGVSTEGDYSDIRIKPEKKKAFPDLVKESSNTVNHKQLFLVNEMKEMLASGFKKENMKTYFLKRGFISQDIDRALKNITSKADIDEEVEEIDAKEIMQYLKDSDIAKKFLNTIKKESIPTTQIYNKLNLSARKGNQLKKELLMFKLIKEVEERNSTGWKKFLKITDTGIDLLARI